MGLLLKSSVMAIAILSMIGCSAPALRATQDADERAKLFKQDRPSLYVYSGESPSVLAPVGLLPITINGKGWGEIDPKTYLYSELEKGRYTLSFELFKACVPLEIDVVENKSYFVELQVLWNTFRFRLVDAEVGKSEILQRFAAQSFSTPKPESRLHIRVSK